MNSSVFYKTPSSPLFPIWKLNKRPFLPPRPRPQLTQRCRTNASASSMLLRPFVMSYLITSSRKICQRTPRTGSNVSVFHGFFSYPFHPLPPQQSQFVLIPLPAVSFCLFSCLMYAHILILFFSNKTVFVFVEFFLESWLQCSWRQAQPRSFCYRYHRDFARKGSVWCRVQARSNSRMECWVGKWSINRGHPICSLIICAASSILSGVRRYYGLKYHSARTAMLVSHA